MAKKNQTRFKAKRPKKGLAINFEIKHREFFQNVSAEREDKLSEYYVNNPYFQSAITEDSKKAFFIGRTGVGKTAILKEVESKTNKKIIKIKPEDFSFQIMERSSILKRLTEYQINLDLFYKTMWKYIFITEILKKIYGNQKKSWFDEKFERFFKDKTFRKAYDFLLSNNELEGESTFRERIKSIIERMEHHVSISLGTDNILKFDYTGAKKPEFEKKVYDGLQEYEFAEINYFFMVLDKEILKSQKLIILIDDLDKNWIQNEIGINFTRCLFETIFEINNSKHLRLLVSLRTNLFIQLQFSQSEKFFAYIEHLSWSEKQMREIIEERLVTAFEKKINKSDIWKHIFPQEIVKDQNKKFPIFRYLIDRSNMRPRDILLFISFFIGMSIGKNNITAETIIKSEQPYSQNRLQALSEEWGNPFLDLMKIFDYFHMCQYKMTKKEFYKIVENITIDVLEKEEAKKLNDWSWIIEGNFIEKRDFNSDELVVLLYKIGFIGIKATPALKVGYIHSNTVGDIPKISNESKFYINPCYHAAIGVKFYT